ncbi:MAG: acyl-CoA dehydrogenase [Magnetococcales bacterium]|nr:acyl-CoA dehydrogenase [Magnetococcales bacterium]
MNFTEDQIMIGDMVAKLCVDEIAPKAEMRDKEKCYPKEEVEALFAHGIMGMTVSENYGGSGADTLSQALSIEHIARANGGLSTIVAVQSLVCGILEKCGNEAQKQKYLTKLTSDTVGAFALTEPHAGSDASALRTTAVREGDFYILNGSKQFITSGQTGGLAIIFAVTDPSAGKKGISAFIVATDSEGYDASRLEDKMGQHCSDTAQVVLTNVKVPAENRIGEEGDGYKIALSNLENGRISIAAQCLGLARAAYVEASSYARDRKTFGKAIAEHQAVGFKLAEMKTKLFAASHMVYEAAALKDSQQPCLQEACMAKLYASEAAIEIADKALQIHGGYGYIQDYPIERIYRDVRVCSLYEGTSDIQKMIISRGILKVEKIRK